MAYIEPFRAFRYDAARVALANVATQPYDKINPEMQERYYRDRPYTLVSILLGKRTATDGPNNNPYTRAASFLTDWRRDGIFVQDADPSLYRYTQTFCAPGSNVQTERRGFIALGRLEDYSANVVFRHEQTLAKPKADRLDLLRATRAHFGQIFMLYSDPAQEIEGLLSSENSSDIETRDEYGVLHCVRKISDPALIELVRGKMREKKLIIADGHHRYETALNYRDERRSMAASAVVAGVPRERSSREDVAHSSQAENAPYELVMMTFVNLDSPGLVILPTHRVVHGLSSFSADQFCDKARAYFSVEEVDPEIDPGRATAILHEAGRVGTALLAVSADRAFLLDRPTVFDSELFAGLSLRQQSLDVVQLHKCLLEAVLGISEESIRNQH